jgi:8-oxo-dGTP pyrophosphatase MutT (NUDIX family)
MQEKKMVDGVLHAVVAVIFDKYDQVLMFLRNGEEWEQGWEPIKGAIHIDETEEQAVLREIEEESGLKNIEIVGRLSKYSWVERPWKVGRLKIKSAVFACRYNGGDITLGEKEHVDYKWMSIDEANEKAWISNKECIGDAYRIFYNARYGQT